MQVPKILNTSNYNTQFKAKIIKTPYLESGIKYAQNQASLHEKNIFLNALEHIKNDTDMKTFSIDGVKGQHTKSNLIPEGYYKKYQININDRKAYENIGSVGNSTDGEQCLYGINDFIFRHYGELVGFELMDKRTSWLALADELEVQRANALIKAGSELKERLEKLAKEI